MATTKMVKNGVKAIEVGSWRIMESPSPDGSIILILLSQPFRRLNANLCVTVQ